MSHSALIACVAIVLATGSPAAAHDDYRVIGVITKIAAKTVDVKDKDGRTVSMRLDEATLVSRDKKTVGRGELKAGVNVVVDASGDSIDDLVVLEVRIVPANDKR